MHEHLTEVQLISHHLIAGPRTNPPTYRRPTSRRGNKRGPRR